MAIVDEKGRVFGKVSLLDVGAGAIIAMVTAGVLLLPGKSGNANKGGKPIEVDVIVRGLNTVDAKNMLKEGEKVNVIIRNEPSGSIDIKKIEYLPRNVTVPQPDGSVKALPDPRPEMRFSTDFIMTLSGNAEVTEDGIVFGNKKVKVGTTLELEGKAYNFNSSVITVRQ
jgi:predicted RecA/RadA family phage recombinase